MQWIVFTDLDGTLLDFEDYSYSVAAPVVAELQQKQIPLVFCSSKTRAEQEYYRRALNNHSPFIVENGSAILIPRNYFPFDIRETLEPEYRVEEEQDYWLLILGETHAYIREVIEQAKEEAGIELWGYADLPMEDIKEITGLDNDFARRAASRDFSETLIKGKKSGPAFRYFQSILRTQGLICVSGGKFHTVMGEKSDKGAAVRVVTRLFKQKYESLRTVGLGDSANDIPLLQAVDTPFLVQRHDGTWLETNNERIRCISGIGPVGWIHALRTVGAI